MTISSSLSCVQYPGDGAQTTFVYPFLVPAQAYAVLILTDSNGNDTTVAPTAWTLDDAGNLTGGTFTYPRPGAGGVPAPLGSTLTLVRTVPYAQVTNLRNQGAYYPQAVEGALDFLAMQTQQLAAGFGHTLRTPASEPSTSVLPRAEQRKNTIQAYDSNGLPVLLPIQPDNNTTVIAQGSTTARTLATRFGEQKNVRDFGAVGDGVADDTAAIQAALNAVPANTGGVVFFPPGHYKTSAPLVIGTHCTTLQGAVLGQNNSIGTEIIGSTNHDIITCTAGRTFVRLVNLAVGHPPGTVHGVASVAVRMQQVAYGSIHNCAVRNPWHGVLIDGCNQFDIDMLEIRAPSAASGASYGLRVVDDAAACLGIHIRGLTLFGINNLAGATGLEILGASTVYVAQAPITKWSTGVRVAAGPTTSAVPSFLRFVQMELENNTNGVDVTSTTRFYAVDCQVALSINHGWRFQGANVGQVMLTGCMSVNNGLHGFFLDTCSAGSFSITGCVASGNGQTTPNTYSGLTISNTNNVTVIGGRFGGSGSGSLPVGATQLNGVRNQGATNTGVSVVGANLQGNGAGFVNGATEAPLVLGCLGYDDAFQQQRAATQANVVRLSSSNAGSGVGVGAAGADTNINLLLQPKGTGYVHSLGPMVLASHTIATLPAAAGVPGGMIYVSNESGGAVPAFSDGTNWRRVTDRAIVS